MGSASSVTAESMSAATTTRRRRSIVEKRRIVEETLLPGASVARVARAHEVNANQVFRWRRQYQRGLLGSQAAPAAFLPVTISDALPAVRLASAHDAQSVRSSPPAATAVRSGVIHCETPRGRLRIEGSVDPASLRMVLEALLG